MCSFYMVVMEHKLDECYRKIKTTNEYDDCFMIVDVERQLEKTWIVRVQK